MELVLIAINSILIMFLWFAVLELYNKINKDEDSEC